MIGWLALAVLVGLFVVLALGARRAWVRQRDADAESAWRAVAARIDHAYSTTDVPHELDRLALPLLARIDVDVVAPELTGPSEGGIQRLFTTSIDGDAVTVGVADLARPVPSLSLRPKGADGPRVGAEWSELDVDLAHVRSRFEVRGEDPAAVNELLGGELGGWLAGGGTDWSIELADRHLLLVRPGLPVEDMVELAAALDAFRSKLPWVIEAEAHREKRAQARQQQGGDGGGSGSKGPKRKRRRRKKTSAGDGAAGSGAAGGDQSGGRSSGGRSSGGQQSGGRQSGSNPPAD